MVAFKKAKETPAEQLLRMIEGPNQASQSPKKARFFSLRPIEKLKQAMPMNIWSWGFHAKRQTDALVLNLQIAQRLVWVVLIGLGVYVAVDLLLETPQKKTALGFDSVTSASASIGEAVKASNPLKSLSEYVVAIQQRNPFTGSSDLPAAESAKTAKDKMKEITSSLVVVGIDRGDPPEAIVEDTQQRRTYFVKIGDDIKGLTVTAIDSKGVSVSYEGEEQQLQ